ncbi:sugar phosphate isomerase/epimerase [Parasulfuritortus cantonensis]|uniref:Sugar phosphate isomerase/epimerase n=2 Tax=Parasulfuritortus cantonensis TaxID=2528202 RepID=A0A4R1BGT4_9PROT|nr:sugar phosphate isomerase/epimerase [Parasulfuritortus cantonensis]
MHPLSLAFLTIPDAGPVEAIRIAARAGFTHVGLRLLPATASEPGYPLSDDDGLLRETQAALRDTGVRVGDVEIVHLKPDTEIADCRPFLDRVAMLDARYVTVVGDDELEARLIDNFARLCEMAAPLGITANLEPMTWTRTACLAQALRVVEQACQPNVGILVDALHFHSAGSSLDELRTLPASWLPLAQICDAPLDFARDPDTVRQLARTARLFPGEGELDLRSFLSRIPESAIISVEVPNREMLACLTPMQRAERAWRSAVNLLEMSGCLGGER